MTRPNRPVGIDGTLVFDAYDLARTWLAVAIAQGDDEGRPELHRATSVEWHHGGVRLVSTDGYLLLRGWVPTKDSDEPEPPLHREPAAKWVVRDLDKRGVALFGWLKAATKGQPDGKSEPIDVALSATIAFDDPTQPVLDASFAATKFRIETPDERLLLDTFDGSFPAWRRFFTDHKPEATATIGVSPAALLRLGGLSKLWGGAVLRLDLSGPLGGVLVTVAAQDCTVEGIAMPARLANTDTPPDPIDLDGRLVDPTTGEILDQATVDVAGDDPAGEAEQTATSKTKARRPRKPKAVEE